MISRQIVDARIHQRLVNDEVIMVEISEIIVTKSEMPRRHTYRPSVAEVCAMHRESVIGADGEERMALFVAVGNLLHAFVGPSVESLFQRYQAGLHMLHHGSWSRTET